VIGLHRFIEVLVHCAFGIFCEGCLFVNVELWRVWLIGLLIEYVVFDLCLWRRLCLNW
jgi:hypothetical protein